MFEEIRTGSNDNCEDESTTRSYETKLDQDFLNFLDEAFKIFDKAKLKQKEKSLVSSWLNRLIGDPAQTVDKKKRRNIYLLELFLQLKDNEVREVFKESPPDGPLKPVDETFSSYRQKRQLCPEEMTNMDLKASGMNFLSEDNRVYCACKVMPEDDGACGFLAVSYGGGDATWLNSQGEPIDIKERTDLTVRYVDSVNDNDFKIENPEASFYRFDHDPNRKNKLRCFFQEICDAVTNELKVIKKSPGKYTGIKHSTVKNLSNNILSVINPGKTDTTINGLDIQPVLYALKLFILCKLESATLAKGYEQDEFDQDIKLVEMSKRIYPSNDQEIWCEAFKIEIDDNCLRQLQAVYPECLIDAFLHLLNKQKDIILGQEQHTYDALILKVQSELYEQVKTHLNEYKSAADEYDTVMKIRDMVDNYKDKVVKDLKQLSSEISDHHDTSGCVDDARQIKELEQEAHSAEIALHEIKKENQDVEMKIKSAHTQLEALAQRAFELKNGTHKHVEDTKNYVIKLRAQLEKQEDYIKNLKLRKTYREQKKPK